MPASEINLQKAKTHQLFYFVANVVVYRESDQRCLILKRDESEVVHPGKYAVPGGKLDWSDFDLEKPTRYNGDVLDYEDAIEKLLCREVYEEAGIEIKDELKYVNSVGLIRPDGVPAILAKFAARYKGGEVKLEEGAFTDFAWVNAEEVKNYSCIQGIPEEIEQTIELFK